MDRAALSAIVETSRGTRIIVYSSVVAAYKVEIMLSIKRQ
jgi:hypothetical protein